MSLNLIRLLTAFLIFSGGLFYVNAQQFNWAFGAGNGFDSDAGQGVAVDCENNVYLTGYINDSVDMDPGPGVYPLIAPPAQEKAFVAKYTPNGSLAWAKIFSANLPGNSDGTGINVDEWGNIYLTIQKSNNFDADPDTSNQALVPAGISGCVIKLNANGNFRWVFPLPPQSGYLRGVEFDQNGNAFTIGRYFSTQDFDPGPGTTTLVNSGPTSPPLTASIFILKIDTAGGLLWARSLDNSATQNPMELGTDPAGNLYISGFFYGPLDLNPGPLLHNVPDNGDPKEFFLIKLRSNGFFEWGITYDQGLSSDHFRFAVDNQEHVYIAAWVNDTLDVNPAPSPGTVLVTPQGFNDHVLIKVDENGDYQWHKVYTGMGYVQDLWVGTDGCQQVFLTGKGSGMIDFDPGPGSDIVNFPLSYRQFLQISDSAGNHDTVFVFGNDNDFDLLSLDVSCRGSIAATGSFKGVADLDPGTATLNYDGDLYGDFFLVNYSSYRPEWDSLQATACDTFVSPGGNILTSSGIYYDTLQNIFGCDSVIHIQLSLRNSTSATISPTSCDSFSLNGQVYTSSGNYVQHLTNQAGCDSTLSISLTLGVSTSGSLTTSVCDSFELNGQVYTTPGVYIQQLTNTAGCDSMLTLNLSTGSVDTSVTVSGGTLTANLSGAQYQWLDCATGLPITGATNSSYTPTISGSYAVHISQGNCSDTSGCHTVMVTGLNDIQTNSVRCYPNPSQGHFTIDLGSGWISGTIKVMHITGSIIEIRETENQINHFHYRLPAGMYFLEVEGVNGISTKKRIIVE